MAKPTILCFGDSNTWGYIPGSFNVASGKCLRYEDNVRWPSSLENELGAVKTN